MQLQHTVVVQVVIVIMANDHKMDVGQLWIIQLEWRLHYSPASLVTSVPALGLCCICASQVLGGKPARLPMLNDNCMSCIDLQY